MLAYYYRSSQSRTIHLTKVTIGMKSISYSKGHRTFIINITTTMEWVSPTNFVSSIRCANMELDYMLKWMSRWVLIIPVEQLLWFWWRCVWCWVIYLQRYQYNCRTSHILGWIWRVILNGIDGGRSIYVCVYHLGIGIFLV